MGVGPVRRLGRQARETTRSEAGRGEDGGGGNNRDLGRVHIVGRVAIRRRGRQGHVVGTAGGSRTGVDDGGDGDPVDVGRGQCSDIDGDRLP